MYTTTRLEQQHQWRKSDKLPTLQTTWAQTKWVCPASFFPTPTITLARSSPKCGCALPRHLHNASKHTCARQELPEGFHHSAS
eukprot:2847839-Amphidinium_carterae.1